MQQTRLVCSGMERTKIKKKSFVQTTTHMYEKRPTHLGIEQVPGSMSARDRPTYSSTIQTRTALLCSAPLTFCRRRGTSIATGRAPGKPSPAVTAEASDVRLTPRLTGSQAGFCSTLLEVAVEESTEELMRLVTIPFPTWTVLPKSRAFSLGWRSSLTAMKNRLHKMINSSVQRGREKRKPDAKRARGEGERGGTGWCTQ